MSYPLRNPDPVANFKAKDFIGDVVIYVHGGYHEAIHTEQYGSKPAVRGTMISLTGRTAGTIYEDVVLWPKQCSQFRDFGPGEVGVSRIVQSGRATVFDVPSGYDIDMAQKWISDNHQRLETLKHDAVRNFHEQSENLAKDSGRSSGPEPRTSPQFRPAQTDATRESLRNPSEPASEEETGY